MAWKKLPVTTKDKDGNKSVEDRIINLDNISYFRPWVDDDGSTDKSIGYSETGKQQIVHMPLQELEDELVNPTKP